MWVNCALGKSAYDMLEHYLRDEHFAGAKLQSLFDGYTADYNINYNQKYHRNFFIFFYNFEIFIINKNTIFW
jgi:hypothetical protein